MVNPHVQLIQEAVTSYSNPTRAKAMAAYMKHHHFKFAGISAPNRTNLLRPIWQDHKLTIKEDIKNIVNELWQLEYREYQMIAMELMGKCKKQFQINDLEFVQKLITTKSWWDSVDFLASNMVGTILKPYPDWAEKSAKEMMSSDHMWLQRTVLIFQLKYKEEVNGVLLYQLIQQTKGSTEFFINKASGWALRQYSKFDPASVTQFIKQNKHWLSKLTVKEGSKYL